MDGHAAMMGHWAPPSPSLKQFFSSYLEGDEQVSLGSMPQMPAEATNASSSVGAHQGISFEDNDPREGGNSFDNHMIFTPVPGQKSTSRGGLADRIAARAGFNASCLNTGSIRLTVQSSSGVKSPYLTIPSSISPTSLLESPVFISNSLTQASPTTGKLPLFLDGNGKVFTAPTNGQNKEDAFDDVNDSSSFAFKPHAEPGLPFSHCIANKVLPNIDVSVRSENNLCNFEPSQVSSHEGLSEPLTDKKHVERNAGSELRSLDTIGGTAEQPPPLSGQNEDEGKQSIVGDSISGGSTDVFADDGYNWRKYGQKQVKGSEFPRSYYKCTYMSCPVKKKVERSVEGHITEIIYRGIHNHPEPAPNRRSSIGSNQLDANHGQVAPENGCDRESFWGASQNGVLPGTREWRNDSLAHNSLTPMSTEIRRLSSSLHMQNGAVVESGDVMDPSSAISCDEEGADPGTHGSVSVANDVEGDESESKRRKLETYAAEVGSGATRAIREPRVVVQTTSDVDILDDGYRWRKYGQKVVKGNPNPRSYYKCTSIGCSVRKHVERASNDLKSVITTYEGKHNHDVPTARNSSHVNSSSYAALGSQGPGFIPRPEQAQVTNMERYVSASHLSSFNMPMMQPLGPPPQGFPMGMNQSSSVNLSTAGMGPGHTKLPGMTTHPCLIQQQPRPENDMSFMIPNSNPNLYLSDGSSVDHQNMNRQPLGP